MQCETKEYSQQGSVQAKSNRAKKVQIGAGGCEGWREGKGLRRRRTQTRLVVAAMLDDCRYRADTVVFGIAINRIADE